MATKNPTLNSYTESLREDTRKFSRAYADAPEWFYETLYKECETLVETLVEYFPVTQTRAGNIINFDKTTFTQFENAIAAEPEIMLQALVAACHMTERMVREHLRIDGLYTYATENASVRGEDRVHAFIANGCLEFLNQETPVETIVFLYYRSQERNRVQHARGAFYEEVHTELEENKFTVSKDESIEGQPNIIINKNGKKELTNNSVVGKALRAKPNDTAKRARHAASCCGKIKNIEPGATRVAVLKITGDPFPNERVREQQRQKILSQHREAIDAVFFHDELDEFITFCDEEITVFGETLAEPGDKANTHESMSGW